MQPDGIVSLDTFSEVEEISSVFNAEEGSASERLKRLRSRASKITSPSLTAKIYRNAEELRERPHTS